MSTRRDFLKLASMIVTGMAQFAKDMDASAKDACSVEKAYHPPKSRDFVETPYDPDLARRLQILENTIDGLPLDTPIFDDNYYVGTIPPTLSEWISKPVYGRKPWEGGSLSCYRYRIFKNKSGDYSLQEIATGYDAHRTILSGDFDYIVEKHKEYTVGGMPDFIQ